MMLTRASLRLVVLSCLMVPSANGQSARDYLSHRRGMLHQAVYNTGELGRQYNPSNPTTVAGIPSFEWPGNFSTGASSNFVTIVDGQQYSGHHNSYGGGVQIGADRVGGVARRYAYCGGLNDVSQVEGQHAFPQVLSRTENYPVLADGSLNPTYNADEAEEIIVTRWATPVGITVTRTSRAWSFPDYDDMIIYEYEFENTGDIAPPAPPVPARLTDVIINFSHGLTGGKFGYNRTGNSWANTVIEPNLNARWDRMRWLQYSLHRTGNPEPKYFAEWATNRVNGGGLLSAQAPGYMVLYYDTLHLARRGDGTRVLTPGNDTVSWDATGQLKQPYNLIIETQQMTTTKLLRDFLDIANARKYAANTDLTTFGPDWVGRARFNWGQSVAQAIGRDYAFGPYHLDPGEKIRITVAEVCGYGAARPAETEAGVKDIGGSNGNATIGQPESGDALFAFYTVPNYWVPKRQNQLNSNSVNTVVYGSDYLSTYALPDHVNSDVVTVREVADRAIEAYTHQPFADHDSLQFWPHQSPAHGVYALPIPVPAPAIVVENTLLGENRIAWGPQVESFTAPRLQGSLHHYEVARATQSIGPWTTLVTVPKGDTRYLSGGTYQFLDKNTRIGDSYYYSVVSVDENGRKSGRTNITAHQSSIGAEASLKRVFVAPNPLVVRSGFVGRADGDINAQLRFYNLPRKCSIRIFSYSGQLVQTIEHDANQNVHPYYQLTRNFQLIASGVYFFVVEAVDGTRTHGKFVVIN